MGYISTQYESITLTAKMCVIDPKKKIKLVILYRSVMTTAQMAETHDIARLTIVNIRFHFASFAINTFMIVKPHECAMPNHTIWYSKVDKHAT